MFGAINLDERITGEWLNEIEKVDKLVSERKGDLLVVCTSRKYIFTDVKSKLHKCQRFSEVNIVDMTDNEYQLSGDEKVGILVKYANRYNINLGAEIVSQIKEVQSPHGFPHCVEMFCTNVFYRKIGVKFFSNPEKVVQKEINNFKDNDPMKFLVLLLVMYHKNRFEKRHIGEMIANSDEDVQKLFSFLSIVQSTAYSGLMKAAKALTNTYLALTKDGYYTFTHESLAENVSKVYMELNSVHATHILSFQEILKQVNMPNDNARLPNHELAERITSELLTGNVDVVSSCASWRDKTFVDEWIRFITIPCKASCSWSSLSKIVLKKILHIEGIGKDSRHVHETTLVHCLLEKGMVKAVWSVLRNKTIQKLFHNDQTWIKALEYALKQLYITTSDVNIVKAIVEPYGQNIASNKILDGSAAFVSVIEASDVECAGFLVNNTKIMFEDAYIRLYFKGMETSSIGFANFIELFDNHEQSSEIKTKLLAYVLRYSSAEECIQKISILKEKCTNFHRFGVNNFNALHIACQRQNLHQCFDVLRYLIDVGVDASQESTEGEVPLMLALENDQTVDVIKWLLSLSPKRHQNKAGQGYFHYLMRVCYMYSFDTLTKLCRVLLKEGEDIDLQDATGTTPVMHLMQCFSYLCVCEKVENEQFEKFFCSVPLNMHLTNDNGQNVLHLIFVDAKKYLRGYCVKERKELHAFLVKKFNVDEQLKDNNGETPRMLASKYGEKSD